MHFWMISVRLQVFLVLGAKPSGDALVDNGVWAAGAGETSQRIANRASIYVCVSRVFSRLVHIALLRNAHEQPPVHPDFHPLPERGTGTQFSLSLILCSLFPWCVAMLYTLATAPICISLAPLCLFIYASTAYLFYLSIYTFSRWQWDHQELNGSF